MISPQEPSTATTVAAVTAAIAASRGNRFAAAAATAAAAAAIADAPAAAPAATATVRSTRRVLTALYHRRLGAAKEVLFTCSQWDGVVAVEAERAWRAAGWAGKEEVMARQEAREEVRRTKKQRARDRKKQRRKSAAAAAAATAASAGVRVGGKGGKVGEREGAAEGVSGGTMDAKEGVGEFGVLPHKLLCPSMGRPSFRSTRTTAIAVSAAGEAARLATAAATHHGQVVVEEVRALCDGVENKVSSSLEQMTEDMRQELARVNIALTATLKVLEQLVEQNPPERESILAQ
jgi:hypothetical protein